MEIAFVGSADKISYVYNGEGKKIEKKVTQGATETTTKYLEGFQYKKINGATDVLQFFPTAEGYVKKTGTSNYNYVFNHKDHLGNIRLSYQDLDNNGTIATSEIIEENHYYPFGLKHSYNSSTIGEYKYKFQGQERQDELGLNWDSFKWRNYDYAIGRFMSIDPLAEKYTYNSPYAFSENRVVDGRELEGLEWVDARDHSVVIYDPQANNGKGDYTSNATDEDRAWGASLNGTPTGSVQFQKLVNMDHPVSITAAYGERRVDTDGVPILGATVTPTTDNPDGATYITIYPANIKDGVQEVQENDKNGLNTWNESKVLLNNVDETEMTGAVLGQEIEHATPENIKMQHDKAPRKEIEKKPDAVSNQILRESGD